MVYAIFFLAHETTVIAYAIFALLVIFRGLKNRLVAMFAAAAAATAIWAQVRVAISLDMAPAWLDALTGSLRDAAWLGLLLALMHRYMGQTRLWHGLLLLTAAIVVAQFSLDVSHLNTGLVAGVHIDGTLMRLAIAILGLVLIENILRNCSSSEFWALKHLLIGLFAILAFLLLSGVPEFLTHREDPEVTIARPLVFLLALPLFVVSSVRFPNLQVRVHSSRTFVFYSATLIGAGILLQGVAAAAWYVREYGGSNGAVLAIILLFGGVVAVLVALVSGTVRSRLRVFINENFFNLKYDYRLEWEKFIKTLSLNPEQGSAERVLRTLCDLLDSSGGALWVHRASWRQLLPAARQGFKGDITPLSDSDPRLEVFHEDKKAFVHLSGDPLGVAWHKDFPDAWIVTALKYRSTIVGIAVLTHPRAPKRLDWEDENLIRLIGMQLGAYLVQEETAQSLADARQLEDFNKRFAFIVHDIKNTIGQLSLLVQNAAKFGHEQEFRDDMVVTLRNAVERMQQLLKSLTVVGNENVPGSRTKEAIDLIDFLKEFTNEKENLGQAIIFDTKYKTLGLEAVDPASLRRVLEHVLTNAAEASGPNKPVEVNVLAEAEKVEIHIVDHGSGMTEKFISEELFRPMRTTKDGGFGIGAFQARELMRDLGGDILVSSVIGEGTCVTLTLPRSSSRGRASE